jgi:hypothetical protein
LSVEIVILPRRTAQIEVATLRSRLERAGLEDIDVRGAGGERVGAELESAGYYLVLVRGTSVPIGVSLPRFDEDDAAALAEIVQDSARNLGAPELDRIVRTERALGYDIHLSAAAGRNDIAMRLMLVLATILAELVDGYVVAETDGLPLQPSRAYRPEAVNRLA